MGWNSKGKIMRSQQNIQQLEKDQQKFRYNVTLICNRISDFIRILDETDQFVPKFKKLFNPSDPSDSKKPATSSLILAIQYVLDVIESKDKNDKQYSSLRNSSRILNESQDAILEILGIKKNPNKEKSKFSFLSFSKKDNRPAKDRIIEQFKTIANILGETLIDKKQEIDDDGSKKFVPNKLFIPNFNFNLGSGAVSYLSDLNNKIISLSEAVTAYYQKQTESDLTAAESKPNDPLLQKDEKEDKQNESVENKLSEEESSSIIQNFGKIVTDATALIKGFTETTKTIRYKHATRSNLTKIAKRITFSPQYSKELVNTFSKKFNSKLQSIVLSILFTIQRPSDKDYNAKIKPSAEALSKSLKKIGTAIGNNKENFSSSSDEENVISEEFIKLAETLVEIFNNEACQKLFPEFQDEKAQKDPAALQSLRSQAAVSVERLKKQVDALKECLFPKVPAPAISNPVSQSSEESKKVVTATTLIQYTSDQIKASPVLSLKDFSLGQPDSELTIFAGKLKNISNCKIGDKPVIQGMEQDAIKSILTSPRSMSVEQGLMIYLMRFPDVLDSFKDLGITEIKNNKEIGINWESATITLNSFALSASNRNAVQIKTEHCIQVPNHPNIIVETTIELGQDKAYRVTEYAYKLEPLPASTAPQPNESKVITQLSAINSDEFAEIRELFKEEITDWNLLKSDPQHPETTLIPTLRSISNCQIGDVPIAGKTVEQVAALFNVFFAPDSGSIYSILSEKANAFFLNYPGFFKILKDKGINELKNKEELKKHIITWDDPNYLQLFSIKPGDYGSSIEIKIKHAIPTSDKKNNLAIETTINITTNEQGNLKASIKYLENTAELMAQLSKKEKLGTDLKPDLHHYPIRNPDVLLPSPNISKKLASSFLTMLPHCEISSIEKFQEYLSDLDDSTTSTLGIDKFKLSEYLDSLKNVGIQQFQTRMSELQPNLKVGGDLQLFSISPCTDGSLDIKTKHVVSVPFKDITLFQTMQMAPETINFIVETSVNIKVIDNKIAVTHDYADNLAQWTELAFASKAIPTTDAIKNFTGLHKFNLSDKEFIENFNSQVFFHLEPIINDIIATETDTGVKSLVNHLNSSYRKLINAISANNEKLSNEELSNIKQEIISNFYVLTTALEPIFVKNFNRLTDYDETPWEYGPNTKYPQRNPNLKKYLDNLKNAIGFLRKGRQLALQNIIIATTNSINNFIKIKNFDDKKFINKFYTQIFPQLESIIKEIHHTYDSFASDNVANKNVELRKFDEEFRKLIDILNKTYQQIKNNSSNSNVKETKQCIVDNFPVIVESLEAIFVKGSHWISSFYLDEFAEPKTKTKPSNTTPSNLDLLQQQINLLKAPKNSAETPKKTKAEKPETSVPEMQTYNTGQASASKNPLPQMPIETLLPKVDPESQKGTPEFTLARTLKSIPKCEINGISIANKTDEEVQILFDNLGKFAATEFLTQYPGYFDRFREAGVKGFQNNSLLNKVLKKKNIEIAWNEPKHLQLFSINPLSNNSLEIKIKYIILTPNEKINLYSETTIKIDNQKRVDVIYVDNAQQWIQLPLQAGAEKLKDKLIRTITAIDKFNQLNKKRVSGERYIAIFKDEIFPELTQLITSIIDDYTGKQIPKNLEDEITQITELHNQINDAIKASTSFFFTKHNTNKITNNFRALAAHLKSILVDNYQQLIPDLEPNASIKNYMKWVTSDVAEISEKSKPVENQKQTQTPSTGTSTTVPVTTQTIVQPSQEVKEGKQEEEEPLLPKKPTATSKSDVLSFLRSVPPFFTSLFGRDNEATPQEEIWKFLTTLVEKSDESFVAKNLESFEGRRESKIEGTDSGINEVLEKCLEATNLAKVYHPAASSMSPLDYNLTQQRQGIYDYCKGLLGFIHEEEDGDGNRIVEYRNGLIDPDKFNQAHESNKPVVMVMNTASAKGPSTTYQTIDKGSHWIVTIILPPEYKPPFGKSLKNKVPLVITIDPMGNIDLPQEFKNKLLQGHGGLETHESDQQPTRTLPNAKFIKNTIPQQQAGNGCAWWVLYDALITVLTGKNPDEFMKPDPHRNQEYAFRDLLWNLFGTNLEHTNESNVSTKQYDHHTPKPQPHETNYKPLMDKQNPKVVPVALKKSNEPLKPTPKKSAPPATKQTAPAVKPTVPAKSTVYTSVPKKAPEPSPVPTVNAYGSIGTPAQPKPEIPEKTLAEKFDHGINVSIDPFDYFVNIHRMQDELEKTQYIVKHIEKEQEEKQSVDLAELKQKIAQVWNVDFNFLETIKSSKTASGTVIEPTPLLPLVNDHINKIKETCKIFSKKMEKYTPTEISEEKRNLAKIFLNEAAGGTPHLRKFKQNSYKLSNNETTQLLVEYNNKILAEQKKLQLKFLVVSAKIDPTLAEGHLKYLTEIEAESPHEFPKELLEFAKEHLKNLIPSSTQDENNSQNNLSETLLSEASPYETVQQQPQASEYVDTSIVTQPKSTLQYTVISIPEKTPPNNYGQIPATSETAQPHVVKAKPSEYGLMPKLPVRKKPSFVSPKELTQKPENIPEVKQPPNNYGPVPPKIEQPKANEKPKDYDLMPKKPETVQQSQESKDSEIKNNVESAYQPMPSPAITPLGIASTQQSSETLPPPPPSEELPPLIFETLPPPSEVLEEELPEESEAPKQTFTDEEIIQCLAIITDINRTITDNEQTIETAEKLLKRIEKNKKVTDVEITSKLQQLEEINIADIWTYHKALVDRIASITNELTPENKAKFEQDKSQTRFNKELANLKEQKNLATNYKYLEKNQAQIIAKLPAQAIAVHSEEKAQNALRKIDELEYRLSQAKKRLKDKQTIEEKQRSKKTKKRRYILKNEEEPGNVEPIVEVENTQENIDFIIPDNEKERAFIEAEHWLQLRQAYQQVLKNRTANTSNASKIFWRGAAIFSFIALSGTILAIASIGVVTIPLGIALVGAAGAGALSIYKSFNSSTTVAASETESTQFALSWGAHELLYMLNSKDFLPQLNIHRRSLGIALIELLQTSEDEKSEYRHMVMETVMLWHQGVEWQRLNEITGKPRPEKIAASFKGACALISHVIQISFAAHPASISENLNFFIKNRSRHKFDFNATQNFATHIFKELLKQQQLAQAPQDQLNLDFIFKRMDGNCSDEFLRTLLGLFEYRKPRKTNSNLTRDEQICATRLLIKREHNIDILIQEIIDTYQAAELLHGDEKFAKIAEAKNLIDILYQACLQSGLLEAGKEVTGLTRCFNYLMHNQVTFKQYTTDRRRGPQVNYTATADIALEFLKKITTQKNLLTNVTLSLDEATRNNMVDLLITTKDEYKETEDKNSYGFIKNYINLKPTDSKENGEKASAALQQYLIGKNAHAIANLINDLLESTATQELKYNFALAALTILYSYPETHAKLSEIINLIKPQNLQFLKDSVIYAYSIETNPGVKWVFEELIPVFDHYQSRADQCHQFANRMFMAATDQEANTSATFKARQKSMLLALEKTVEKTITLDQKLYNLIKATPSDQQTSDTVQSLLKACDAPRPQMGEIIKSTIYQYEKVNEECDKEWDIYSAVYLPLTERKNELEQLVTTKEEELEQEKQKEKVLQNVNRIEILQKEFSTLANELRATENSISKFKSSPWGIITINNLNPRKVYKALQELYPRSLSREIIQRRMQRMFNAVNAPENCKTLFVKAMDSLTYADKNNWDYSINTRLDLILTYLDFLNRAAISTEAETQIVQWLNDLATHLDAMHFKPGADIKYAVMYAGKILKAIGDHQNDKTFAASINLLTKMFAQSNDSEKAAQKAAAGAETCGKLLWHFLEVTDAKEDAKVTKEQLIGKTVKEQFDRDFKLWDATLAYQSPIPIEEYDPEKERVGILKRMFALMNFGGLKIFDANGNEISAAKMPEIPLAAFLSHGGRIAMAIPSSIDPKRFWNWFTTGDPNNDRTLNRNVDKSKNSEAMGDQSTMFNRPGAGATHEFSITADGKLEETKRGLSHLPKMGLETVKDALINGHFTPHWGMNLAIGGAGNISDYDNKPISADGSHGHLYVYYKDGILALGLEGSEYNRKDHYNDRTHNALDALFGGKGKHSALGNLKWTDKGFIAGSEADFGKNISPAKLGGLIINLDEDVLEKLITGKLDFDNNHIDISKPATPQNPDGTFAVQADRELGMGTDELARYNNDLLQNILPYTDSEKAIPLKRNILKAMYKGHIENRAKDKKQEFKLADLSLFMRSVYSAIVKRQQTKHPEHIQDDLEKRFIGIIKKQISDLLDPNNNIDPALIATVLQSFGQQMLKISKEFEIEELFTFKLFQILQDELSKKPENTSLEKLKAAFKLTDAGILFCDLDNDVDAEKAHAPVVARVLREKFAAIATMRAAGVNIKFQDWVHQLTSGYAKIVGTNQETKLSAVNLLARRLLGGAFTEKSDKREHLLVNVVKGGLAALGELTSNNDKLFTQVKNDFISDLIVRQDFQEIVATSRKLLFELRNDGVDYVKVLRSNIKTALSFKTQLRYKPDFWSNKGDFLSAIPSVYLKKIRNCALIINSIPKDENSLDPMLRFKSLFRESNPELVTKTIIFALFKASALNEQKANNHIDETLEKTLASVLKAYLAKTNASQKSEEIQQKYHAIKIWMEQIAETPTNKLVSKQLGKKARVCAFRALSLLESDSNYSYLAGPETEEIENDNDPAEAIKKNILAFLTHTAFNPGELKEEQKPFNEKHKKDLENGLLKTLHIHLKTTFPLSTSKEEPITVLRNRQKELIALDRSIETYELPMEAKDCFKRVISSTQLVAANNRALENGLNHILELMKNPALRHDPFGELPPEIAAQQLILSKELCKIFNTLLPSVFPIPASTEEQQKTVTKWLDLSNYIGDWIYKNSQISKTARAWYNNTERTIQQLLQEIDQALEERKEDKHKEVKFMDIENRILNLNYDEMLTQFHLEYKDVMNTAAEENAKADEENAKKAEEENKRRQAESSSSDDSFEAESLLSKPDEDDSKEELITRELEEESSALTLNKKSKLKKSPEAEPLLPKPDDNDDASSDEEEDYDYDDDDGDDNVLSDEEDLPSKEQPDDDGSSSDEEVDDDDDNDTSSDENESKKESSTLTLIKKTKSKKPPEEEPPLAKPNDNKDDNEDDSNEQEPLMSSSYGF